MALPQQVVEQLSRGTQRTPGWSSGILLFSGSVLFIVALVYAGLRFGYEPYLNGQISSLRSQAQKAGQSVSPEDEATLIRFYSQISNIQSLLKNHVFFSQFLAWLEQRTEANVYYTSMAFSSGSQIALVGAAKTPVDISEQVAVFEAAPEVASVSLSSVTYAPATNVWNFSIVIAMRPSVFLWSAAAVPGAPLSAPTGTSPAAPPTAPTGTLPASTTTKP